MNKIVSQILNEKWGAYHPTLTVFHFGEVLRFYSNKRTIAAHHHLGFDNHRFYLGFPGRETPITEKEFRSLEDYAISFCQRN